MTDKESNLPTDPELVLDYIDQLKADNKRLKEEIKKNKQPKFSLNGKGLARAFNHWTWWVPIIMGCIYFIVLIWPSTYETGKFYVTNTRVKYSRLVKGFNISEWGNCYEIVGEVKNGTDNLMSGCFESKNKAYQIANEFTDDWKKLKEKEE